ncbi:hypothetical protein FRC01_003470 [Tulasnella sp. 417]|nr:hypothetical protein FRC01_003470 [Tulasnella sp. 417]
MAIPANFLALAFPNSVFNGSITDAGGRIMYTLTSEARKFRSNVTTVTRSDADVVAVIQWGSVIRLKRRSVILTNATIPAKRYLTEGKIDSLGGRGSQGFQDLEANVYYWKNQECYDGKKKALVAYYQTSGGDSTLAKAKKKATPDPAGISSDGPRSHTPSSQSHGAAGGYLGANAIQGGVENDGGVHEESNDHREGRGSGVGDGSDGWRTPSETSSSQRHGTAGGYVGASALAGGLETDGAVHGGSNSYGGAYGGGAYGGGGGGFDGGGYGGADGGGGGGGFGGGDGGAAGGYGGDGGAAGGYGGDGGAAGGYGGGDGGAAGGYGGGDGGAAGGYGGGFGGGYGGYGGGYGGGGGSWGKMD